MVKFLLGRHTGHGFPGVVFFSTGLRFTGFILQRVNACCQRSLKFVFLFLLVGFASFVDPFLNPTYISVNSMHRYVLHRDDVYAARYLVKW